MCQKKLNTHYVDRSSFSRIQQQSSVLLTFSSIPRTCHYVLMLAQRPKDPFMNTKHAVCSFMHPVFIYLAHMLPLLLLCICWWSESTSGGSELCAAMGLLRWSIIYYGTQLSAEWQMPVREMGPGRSELGYWPQQPHQTERESRERLSLIASGCFPTSFTINWYIYSQISNLPQLYKYYILVSFHYKNIYAVDFLQIVTYTYTYTYTIV